MQPPGLSYLTQLSHRPSQERKADDWLPSVFYKALALSPLCSSASLSGKRVRAIMCMEILFVFLSQDYTHAMSPHRTRAMGERFRHKQTWETGLTWRPSQMYPESRSSESILSCLLAGYFSGLGICFQWSHSCLSPIFIPSIPCRFSLLVFISYICCGWGICFIIGSQSEQNWPFPCFFKAPPLSCLFKMFWV